MGEFWWTLKQGLFGSFLILLSPVGWLLAVAALLSGTRALHAKAWPARTWLFLAWPALICEVLVLLGMVYCRDSDPTIPAEATLLLKLTVGAYFLGAPLLVYFHKQFRAATCVVLILGTFPVLGCCFVAAMSISGEWL